MSLESLHKAVFRRTLCGLSLHYLEEQVERFLKEYLTQELYMPAVNELRLAQQLGHYTVILSNSPNFLVAAVAKFFSVNEWRATEYGVDGERKLSKISLIMDGAAKALHLHELSKKLGIQKQAITAYSDSYLDLDFLNASGTPVAVNPDRKLRALSLQRKWSMI
jgi:phosphoserine phosphatase